MSCAKKNDAVANNSASQVVEKYTPYSRYKNSGEKWLGQIPYDWKVLNLKHCTDRISRGKAPAYVDASHMKVINQACIQWAGLNILNARYHDETIPPPDELLQLDDILVKDRKSVV